MTRRTYLWLGLLGLGMLACFVAVSTLSHFTRRGYTFLAYFGIAFVLYLLAIILIWQRPIPDDRWSLGVIFTLALLLRVPLWFTTPTLSSDVWRYLWDARLMNNGVNPYSARVDSPALDDLATPLRDRVEQQLMASPYPPAAQVTFAAIYHLAPESPTAMQVTSSFFDLATGAVLILALRHLSLPPARSLLYLWHPLVVIESAHSAHLDALMTLGALLAVYWLMLGNHTRSVVALALATLAKFMPALLLPVVVRRWGLWRTVAYMVLVALAFVPFLGAGLGLDDAADGTGVFGATRIYIQMWKTNDGLFYWLVRALENQTPKPILVGKWITATILAGVGLWILLRSGSDQKEKDDQAIIQSSLWLISAYLLLAAAVFPWYLILLLALLPLLRLRQNLPLLMFTVAWLYFSAAVNLSYLFYLDPLNPGEIEWVRRVEYLPPFAMLGTTLLIWLWQQTQNRAAPASGEHG